MPVEKYELYTKVFCGIVNTCPCEVRGGEGGSAVYVGSVQLQVVDDVCVRNPPVPYSSTLSIAILILGIANLSEIY